MSLYNTTKTLVIIGDTNNGKSATINTMLSSLLGQPIYFYESNKINASKTVTIFNFTQDKSYKIKTSHKTNIYDNLDDLQNKYNIEIEKKDDYYDQPVSVYLYSEKKYDFIIIDIIGKSINNEEFYESQLRWINKNYPNNIKIYTTKDINIDICSKNEYILITHADKINYTLNETLKEIHYALKDRFLDNTIKFVNNRQSNVFNILNKLKLKNIELEVLNKNNINKYIFDMLLKIKIIEILDITNFIEYMINIKWTDINDIIYHLNKFNNKMLLEITINELNNLESSRIIHKKILLFNEEINKMKNLYECFRKNNSGIKANQYLKNYIISNFGLEYEKYNINEITDIYIDDVNTKYCTYINKSYELYNKYNKKRKINEE
jgi:hypothetical protein